MRTTIPPQTCSPGCKNYKSKIWRTDEKGTIVVTCDKDHMEMDWEMSDKDLAA
mgnify:CR=1 FL=1